MAKRNGGSKAGGAGRDEVALTLVILRVMRGWNQDRLAKESGVRNAAISEYEGAKKVPELRTLRRLLAAMGWRLSVLDHARRFVELLRLERDAPGGADDAAQLGDLPAAAGAMRPSASELGLAAAQASAAVSRLAGLVLVAAAPQPCVVTGNRGEVREDAAPAGWTACMRHCEESLHAAAGDGGQAVTLAEAALASAERIEGEEAWRCRLLGYALAHLANARRVQGDLPAAEAAMAAALAAWARGAGAADERLDEALVLSLEASLRRAQGRVKEALALLDRALAAGSSRHLTAVNLIKKATTLEELGRYDEAMALLLFTKPLVHRDREPRLLLCIETNLADLLSKAERFEEARAQLPVAQRLAREAGRELDLVRLRWIEGRIAAGLGDMSGGAQLLASVRGELASRGIAYDTALVTLELAVLYAQEGRTSEVKSLGRHLVPLFRSQAIHAGALAALAVFRQAAERERVTVELAREIGGYLARARNEPGLRYGG